MQKILRFRTISTFTLIAVAVWANSAAAAITIKLDYSSDTTAKFFGAGNPQGAAAGAQAKAAMDAAAAFYSGILDDTFSTIKTPDKFYGSLGGEASWFWKRRYSDPATGNTISMLRQESVADEFVVFVGARDLPDDKTLGLGGPGSVTEILSKHGLFTSQESTQITQTQTNSQMR